MSAIQTPKSVPELIKLIVKHGKRTLLVSGVDPSGDKSAVGKVVIDLRDVEPLHEIDIKKDRITIGTGMNLGRLAREATGENGLLQQAASIIANPLVRNKITFVEALTPDSPYFDITTPLMLLEAKVRLQNATGKRTMSIRDFLEAVTKGLKKGEIPIAVEFARLAPEAKVGFFRVARMGGKGTVSAAARMKLVRTVCVDPEIVVSSLTLVPLRAKLAEKEIEGKPANEASIKRAGELAAEEILSMAEKNNAYERTLIEITVARTLRSIMEGSIPV
jgi:aerobic carbon-monoxide dehydrogenase medium subunit